VTVITGSSGRRGVNASHRIYFTSLVLCIIASIAEGQSPPGAVDAYNRAAACYKKGDIDGAIVELTQAIEISSRPGIPRSGAAGAFYFEKIKVLDPLTAAAYSNRGLMRFLKRNFDGAIKDCTEGLKINPRLAGAYIYRGISRSAKKEFDAALSDLNRALTIDPRNTDALNNRGLVYTEIGDFDKAISDLDQAIKLNSRLIEAYYNRGFALRGKGDRDGSLRDFDHALTLNPRSAMAISDAAWFGRIWKTWNELYSNTTARLNSILNWPWPMRIVD
jgi:tetratricopeptide (TPR) repeat protein